jgi:hypothetical protein
MTIKHALLAGVAVLALAGCFRTTVRSGLPIGPTPIEYDDKWHHGFIFGMVEVSGPYDLQRICPQGWSQVHTETTFLNGLVQAFTGIIYNPQSVTIRCAAGQPPGGASAGSK